MKVATQGHIFYFTLTLLPRALLPGAFQLVLEQRTLISRSVHLPTLLHHQAPLPED